MCDSVIALAIICQASNMKQTIADM